MGLGDEFKAEDVLEAMDANHDGTIDLDEWLNCMTKELRIAINSKLHKKEKLDGFKPLINVAGVFDQMDADNSGTLSKDEIKNAMVCLGLKAWDADEFFVGLDENADGEISLQEFKDNLPSYVYKAMAQKLNDQGLIEGM
jgi:Ca2+-binding EF-hand superfamily protein